MPSKRIGAVIAATALLVGSGGAAARAADAPGAGTLVGLGGNSSGHFAGPGAGGYASTNTTPEPITLPTGVGPIADVAVGSGHVLALTADGRVFAWGSNADGQLGVSTPANYRVAPVEVTLPAATGTPTRIAAGGRNSLVLTSSGQLYAFGANTHGQLGTTGGSRVTPALVSLPATATGKITAMAVGGIDHALLVTSTGELYGWGADFYGQIGRPVPTPSHTPNPTLERIDGGSIGAAKIVEVSAGPSFSLVRSENGVVYGFGYNSSGQLGTTTNFATNNPNPTPTTVVFPPPEIVVTPSAKAAAAPLPPVLQRRASAIEAGDDASLAVVDGRVWSWGDNSFLALGRPLSGATRTPTPDAVTLPGTSSAVAQLGSAGPAGYATTAKGELYAWGANSAGQLGNPALPIGGTLTPTPPFLPAGITVAKVVGTGSGSSQSDGTALALVSDLDVAATPLPAARRGEPYTATVAVTGGIAPVTVGAGALPAGLAFDAATRTIAGTPTAEGATPIKITATDRYGITATRELTLTVAPPIPAPAPPAGGGGVVAPQGDSPRPPAPKPGRVTLAKLTTKGATVTVTLACAPGAGPCQGTVLLARRAPATRQPKARKAATAKPLATKAYNLAAGRRKAIKITINKAGRASLKKARRLAIVVTVKPAAGGGAALSRKRTLASPAPKAKPRSKPRR